MQYAILGACVVPSPEWKADADPDLVLSRTVLAGARAARLKPGDVVLFARLHPQGDFQVLDGSCEDWEGE